MVQHSGLKLLFFHQRKNYASLQEGLMCKALYYLHYLVGGPMIQPQNHGKFLEALYVAALGF